MASPQPQPHVQDRPKILVVEDEFIIALDLSETVQDLGYDLEGPFDAVGVDPPPSGLGIEVIDGLGRLAAPLIVYVSSDPATLARDARRLVDNHGYRLAEVQPVDMHPQAMYVDSVAVLSRD